MRTSGSLKSTVKIRYDLVLTVTLSALLISITTGLFLYFGNTENTIGAGIEDPINPGKTISHFSWKYDDPLKADIGEDALSVNSDVVSGRSADMVNGGLAPKSLLKDVKFVLKPNGQLNGPGIDISVNFRADETPGGSFYSRGSNFNFGIRKGALAVTYTLKTNDGKERTYTEISNYEIPLDAKYRAYRFLYTEWSGKLELFVNNVPVLTKQHKAGQELIWRQSDDIIIGRNIYGLKDHSSVLDELVIKSTYKQQELPMDLLGFLTGINNTHVKLTWITKSEIENKGFTIERSEDAINFKEIGFIKGAGSSNLVNVYEFTDIKPLTGLSYYRLKPLNYNGDSTILPIVAQKYQSDDKQKASLNLRRKNL